jgi:hypothetical protein
LELEPHKVFQDTKVEEVRVTVEELEEVVFQYKVGFKAFLGLVVFVFVKTEGQSQVKLKMVGKQCCISCQ